MVDGNLATAINTNSSSAATSITTLSGSASAARQLIAGGIETGLSASASTARDVLVTKISGSSTAQIVALSGSASAARKLFAATTTNGFTTAANNLIAVTNLLSSSLTTTNQTISQSVATLSGSTSTVRNVIATTVSASDASLLTRINGDYIEQINLGITVDNNSGSAATATTALSSSASTARNNITNVLSSSYAVTASYAVSSSVEILKEISSSYADTASYAISSSNSFTSSYAETASRADYSEGARAATFAVLAFTASTAESTGINGPLGKNSILSSSYAITSSYALTSPILSGSASTARSLLASQAAADLTSVSNITATIVSNLSGSTSTARNVIVASISGSSTAPIAALSASSAISITDNANGIITTFTSLTNQITAKANTNYVNSEVLKLENADIALSSSLTVTDQAISSSVAALSGSSVEARKALQDDYKPKLSGSFAQYISRTDQTGIADTIHFVTHNSTTIQQGTTLAVNDYEITVTDAGIYELKNTTQWQRATAVADSVSLWIQVNGVNIQFSTNSVNLTDNFITPLYSQWILDLNAFDVVRIAWSSTEGSAELRKLAAFTNPTRPLTPSANTQLIKIGD